MENIVTFILQIMVRKQAWGESISCSRSHGWATLETRSEHRMPPGYAFLTTR